MNKLKINTPSTQIILNARHQLIDWYNVNKRQLPWRSSKDPYRVWISEVMLQQTTVTAVIPYYDRFLKRFPQLKTLAEASIEDVYEYWAGLGYYSRARNLHKAAQMMHQNGFPQTAHELLQLPGFGPYTSRAVASLAFSEPVGVLDGNVIRVLSRRFGLHLNWWETHNKKLLQDISDQMAHCEQNSDVNQGLMELGATLCTPKKVLCALCPWKKECLALKTDQIDQLPHKKTKPDFEKWHWTFNVQQNKKSQIFLIKNKSTPFLKDNLLPKSIAVQVDQKPHKYDFKHGVTKYEIYVTIKTNKNVSPALALKNHPTGLWSPLADISKINPTSLMKKIIKYIEN